MAEYIERGKTVELLRSLGSKDYRRENGTIQDAIKMLSSPEYTPSADVAPVVHARWIPDGDLDYCSLCHCEKLSRDRYGYCPKCGAKMDLEDPQP